MSKASKDDWARLARGIDGRTKPEAISIAKNIHLAAFRAGHRIRAIYGYSDRGTEHASGLALDVMVENRAAGDFIAAWVWSNRERYRLRHIIWWQRIRSTTREPERWRQMEDRGDPTSNHKDHPHVYVNAGRYQSKAAWLLSLKRRK